MVSDMMLTFFLIAVVTAAATTLMVVLAGCVAFCRGVPHIVRTTCDITRDLVFDYRVRKAVDEGARHLAHGVRLVGATAGATFVAYAAQFYAAHPDVRGRLAELLFASAATNTPFAKPSSPSSTDANRKRRFRMKVAEPKMMWRRVDTATDTDTDSRTGTHANTDANTGAHTEMDSTY
jgi:hypothetical protein